VGDELGLDTPGAPQQIGETAEQLVVGDRLERAFLHEQNIGLAFSTSWERACGSK
jgi:hypothetical protein